MHTDHNADDDASAVGTDAELESLLTRTSRTFALTIPLLPEPTRRAVTVAYLLFRIADTFEDATTWSVPARTAALGDFAALLAEPASARAEELAAAWAAHPPLEHEGYVDLLRRTPGVIDAFRALAPSTREILREHVHRTSMGMREYVARGRKAGTLELHDVEDLRSYCYVVAGIVGEMLTELFIDDHPVVRSADGALRERARYYGEGLQLTNILKDRATDVSEGRRFLPAGVDRDDVFRLARGDLALAEEYLHALQHAGAPRGLLAFNALPMLLAWGTLDRVERDGPGAKLTRPEVFRIIGRMEAALDADEPISGAGCTATPGS